MSQIVLRSIFFVALAALLISTNLNAQQKKDAASAQDLPAAPVPVQILNAKKVFIANGGAAVYGIRQFTAYHGGPNRPYNEFYAVMKKWGRYELAASPADADLVLEVSLTPSGSAGDFPSLHLAIVDPKTHILLWAINERVEGAALLGHRDDNFDHGMSALVGDLKTLDALPKTNAERRQD
jgi:hypothetical protein